MKQKENISIHELTQLIKSAFISSKVSPSNAGIVANALVKAEIDGKTGHGISRVVSYASQSQVGKVDGFAKPVEKKLKPSVVSINACNGFAYPALDKLLHTLQKLQHHKELLWVVFLNPIILELLVISLKKLQNME